MDAHAICLRKFFFAIEKKKKLPTKNRISPAKKIHFYFIKQISRREILLLLTFFSLPKKKEICLADGIGNVGIYQILCMKGLFCNIIIDT